MTPFDIPIWLWCLISMLGLMVIGHFIYRLFYWLLFHGSKEVDPANVQRYERRQRKLRADYGGRIDEEPRFYRPKRKLTERGR